MMFVPSEAKPRKAEETRSRIIESALALFAERGYEQTTMRAIAKTAGVSVGNAYYYFDSKEALMQGYYEGLFKQFAERAKHVLTDETRFANRYRDVLLEWVDTARPYHGFAGGFFRFAANPASPLSPFSPQSAPTRDASIELMQRVVDGSKRFKVANELRPELPRLLWLFHMGTVLHWVYDTSPDQAKTKLLIERTVPMLERIIGLSRLPILKSSTHDVLKLVGDLTLR